MTRSAIRREWLGATQNWESTLEKDERKGKALSEAKYAILWPFSKNKKKINQATYGLKLPDNWRIHNAFHVILLGPFQGEVPEDMTHGEQPHIKEIEEILQSL